MLLLGVGHGGLAASRGGKNISSRNFENIKQWFTRFLDAAGTRLVNAEHERSSNMQHGWVAVAPDASE